MAAQAHRAGHLQVATLLAAVGLAARMAVGSPAAEPPARGAEAIPGACLFTNGGVLSLRIEISPADVASLRRDSRKSVRAALREGKTVQADIGLHLKGSTGSFRSIDDKPGLTLSFDKFVAGQTFHGLRKIHLNNSLEDPSFLNEKIGGELFRAAGVPAPRVGWATVALNGRRLGMYVLKEGFTEDFLGLHFKNPTGNLYEGSGHDWMATTISPSPIWPR
ncbi:MAG: CotH kinase family protein [Verrucomicrobia bacterium]|nr:CotH kinase family protein [Verrucomicrobiota bacterium]